MSLPVIIEEIADISQQTLIDLFETVQHKPWAFLLDSCGQHAMGGRYDIMVSEPCITYEFTSGQHHVKGPSANFKNANNFFELGSKHKCPYKNLHEIQTKFNALFSLNSKQQPKIPFIIGAIGLYAYDGNIQSDHIIDGHPRQYDLPDISVGFYQNSVVYDNLENMLYICASDSGFMKSIKQQLLLGVKQDNKAKLNQQKFTLTNDWKSNVSYQHYLQSFAKIKSYLEAGDCYQVNFAQRFSARYSGDEWQAYLQLRKVNKAPFSAFVRLPKSTVLSLSPERFLLVKDELVESKPIKGTRSRSQDSIVDLALANELRNAEKDKAENLMIVDLLRNDLSKHCQNHSVKVPSLFALESYPAVHHLVSTVVGKLKPNASNYDLLNGAFPGGSITGAPKLRAMQIIQELEPDKRAIYCGSIVYVGIRNDMDSNICIRTLLAEKGNIHCWAGGGIVIDSEGNDEYNESLHKVSKILPILTTKSKATTG